MMPGATGAAGGAAGGGVDGGCCAGPASGISSSIETNPTTFQRVPGISLLLRPPRVVPATRWRAVHIPQVGAVAQGGDRLIAGGSASRAGVLGLPPGPGQQGIGGER